MRLERVESFYPLSPMQEGLLFHSLVAPGAYFEQVALKLDGDLDVAKFRKAWQLAVDRHAILRTHFAWDGLEEAVQIVNRQVELPFTQEDWHTEPAAEHETRLSDLLERDRSLSFDLNKPPLTRLTVVRLGQQSHQMLWSFHHALLDGWSMFLLFQEVFSSYAALAEGREPGLDPPACLQGLHCLAATPRT